MKINTSTSSSWGWGEEGCGSIEREFTFRNFGDKQEADTPQKLFRHVFLSRVFFFFMKSSFAVTIFCSTQTFHMFKQCRKFILFAQHECERGAQMGYHWQHRGWLAKGKMRKCFKFALTRTCKNAVKSFAILKDPARGWRRCGLRRYTNTQHGESSSKSHLIRCEI